MNYDDLNNVTPKNINNLNFNNSMNNASTQKLKSNIDAKNNSKTYQTIFPPANIVLAEHKINPVIETIEDISINCEIPIDNNHLAAQKHQNLVKKQLNNISDRKDGFLKTERSILFETIEQSCEIPNEIFALYLDSQSGYVTTSNQNQQKLINTHTLIYKKRNIKENEEAFTPAKKTKENKSQKTKAPESNLSIQVSPNSNLLSSPSSSLSLINRASNLTEYADDNDPVRIKVKAARRYNLKVSKHNT